MKRGKDEEKIMGPMFPRLHVNDTEKGGPRAPPRNKMALYEQLCIPSQRFNPGVLPLNPNNTSNLVPLSSSSQGSGLERNLLFPRPLNPSPSTYQAEKFHAPRSDGAKGSSPLAQLEQRKRVGDEDDFMVPVFVQSRVGQSLGKFHNGFDKEKLAPVGPTHSEHPMKGGQSVFDKDPEQFHSVSHSSREEVHTESVETPIVGGQGTDLSGKSATNHSTREKNDASAKEARASPNQECRRDPVHNFSRLPDSDACLQQESRAESRLDSLGLADGLVESTRDKENGTASQEISDSPSEGVHNSPNVHDNDSECIGERTCISLHIETVDKSDDVSETSMVDSMVDLDISPDDVVGIIGQKHFWKARRAIVNQQRVFAIQVFELHRLIKVQQLIAASPHLLLEDSAFLGKSSLTGSLSKKLPSQYVVKPLPQIVNHKDDSEKTSHKMECSAENAVAKTSLSSVKIGSQPSNYGRYFGNPQPAPVATDNKMGPWCFHQSAGQQWLIPVMSPSEGLVYKPYPGPAFMGAVCGPPFNSTPVSGNFMNSSYGVPSSHHHGMGIIPGSPPVVHAYFPPYGMPVGNPVMPGSAVEQMDGCPGPGSHNQHGQVSEAGANFNMQQQSSCNVPTQKNVPQSVRSLASKGSELQGSTASSPGERVQGVKVHSNAEGRDALQLFPTAPAAPEGAPQPHGTDLPTRVIRVVPHNPRSATESAARIFQSIQEERKQFDSV
ncbi:protein EARLY FLOWERING 3 isoform X2 [Ziziphus jujuba]|uniref:Protein EARLY FLOWERING 3 isoform X2 n=1 Tax=Ziziphus jujuba TaxID=326968 RepID=A0A6P3ZUH7_ZIZJJ|nr:protein EARLY FLOWERING 3 isoform X2 [Ziziphus jujuba]